MRRWYRLTIYCLTSFVILFILFRLHTLLAPITKSNQLTPVAHFASALPKRAPTQCTYFTCFNASKCAFEYSEQPLNRITVYVYPQVEHVSISGRRISIDYSNEQVQLLRALRNSRYTVNEPSKACVFVPSVDLLNGISPQFTHSLQTLSSLPWWNGGTNHLLFTILRGKYSIFSGNAIMANAVHSKRTYRPTFDVSIPAFNPLFNGGPSNTARTYLLTIFPTADTNPATIEWLLRAYRKPNFTGNASVVVFDPVLPSSQAYGTRAASISHSPYQPPYSLLVDYGDTLRRSVFCLFSHVPPVNQLSLFDSMGAGCIPVIADDDFILPFSEVLDWSKIGIRVRHEELHKLVTTLTSFTSEEIALFQRQVNFVFNRYFSTIEKIVHTSLDIINDRVFPYYARSYVQWNSPDYIENGLPSPPLLFYPTRSSGRFTALIRARDHFSLLHQLLSQLHFASSLHRIVVLWTNPVVPIPSQSLWPSLRVPLSVLPFHQMTSGRYYPHAQIETEAILSLEDSTCLPNLNQIETGFELWRRHPDRLISISNATVVRYPEESSNNDRFLSAFFSVTFFHKHYLHSYTELLSHTALRPVNHTGACEELLMNWLIIQLSGRSVLIVHDKRPTQKSPASCQLQPSLNCWNELHKAYPYFKTLLSHGREFRIAPWTVSSFS